MCYFALSTFPACSYVLTSVAYVDALHLYYYLKVNQVFRKQRLTGILYYILPHLQKQAVSLRLSMVEHCAGDKTLDGYQKKKYVCKLLFIFLLGHDIDFGHMEAVNLLSSNKYTEKQIVSHIAVIILAVALLLQEQLDICD